VIPVSSAALFLRPHRGAVFKQRPQRFGHFHGRDTVIFCRVLIEAKKHFDFEMRGLVLDKAWLSFYIKPAEGLDLPEIMQWLKQTFSVRFNITTLRTGHVWGDRYKSKILLGEPPENAVPVDWNRRRCFFPAWYFFAAAPWRIVQATPSMFRAR
jgi:hypothetical protein